MPRFPSFHAIRPETSARLRALVVAPSAGECFFSSPGTPKVPGTLVRLGRDVGHETKEKKITFALVHFAERYKSYFLNKKLPECRSEATRSSRPARRGFLGLLALWLSESAQSDRPAGPALSAASASSTRVQGARARQQLQQSDSTLNQFILSTSF